MFDEIDPTRLRIAYNRVRDNVVLRDRNYVAKKDLFRNLVFEYIFSYSDVEREFFNILEDLCTELKMHGYHVY